MTITIKINAKGELVISSTIIAKLGWKPHQKVKLHSTEQTLTIEPLAKINEQSLYEEIRKITKSLRNMKAGYDPEAEQELREMFEPLQNNPPDLTIKEWMESTRGRGNYDPD